MSNNWKDEYKKKLISAEEAAAMIQSHEHICLGASNNDPRNFLEALALRKDELEDVVLSQMLSVHPHKFLQPGYENHLRYNTFYATGPARKIINEKRGTYTPIHFSQVPELWGEKYYSLDWSICGVSAPNEYGYVSFSVGGCSYALPATRVAKKKVISVNKYLPFVNGDTMMHISEVDFIIEDSYPLVENDKEEPKEVHKTIAGFVADLIDNGSTIQLGIGVMADAIAGYLVDKRDLGVHSEMLTSNMVTLFKKGVINNTKKALHRNKMIGAFAWGSQELYDFCGKNPSVEMYPVNYVNARETIAQNNNMVSILSALEIDLTGQVCSESIGYRHYSGTAGAADYARGVLYCKDGKGKGIIGLESTAKGDTVSKIVVSLKPGAGVSIPRTDVNYIVTEYGVAQLRGKSIPQRVKEMIGIAHPKFREELTSEAKKCGLI